MCVWSHISQRVSKLREKWTVLSHVLRCSNAATLTVIPICNEGLFEGTSHISFVHSLWTVVWKDLRFPSPRGNSPHGTLLQWGCDVRSFNIPWLYNKTWVTSNGTLRPCSPSAHLSNSPLWISGELVPHPSLDGQTPGQMVAADIDVNKQPKLK